MARAISRRPPQGCDRGATRPGGPLRADRIHLPGLRDRPSGPAASPARRPYLARRPRIPRKRGGRHAGLDRRIGQQRPQTGARQPAAPKAADREPPPASDSPSEDAIVANFVSAFAVSRGVTGRGWFLIRPRRTRAPTPLLHTKPAVAP